MLSIETLSTDDLLVHFGDIVDADREITASIVACLAELDERRVHLSLGFSSLHSLCTEQYGFSDDVAFKRIRAARVARNHPEVIEYLETGDISVSGLVVLAPHLDDMPQLLDAAVGKSVRQIEAMVAKFRPDPDSPRGYQNLRPVGPDAYKLEVVLTTEQRDKLDHARALARHRNPDGDIAQLLEQALDGLIKRLEKEQFGVTDRPRQTGRAATDNVSAQVRRAVYERDGGCCAYVGSDGHRCESRDFLELDHIVARALGGADTVDNLRLTCRPHNQYAAWESLGDTYVAARARALAERERRRRAETEGVHPCSPPPSP